MPSPMLPGYLAGYYGELRIYESPAMVETKEVEVPRSFYDRWIYPLFVDPISAPFEPWVKTKRVERTVPMQRIVKAGDRLIMHPAMAKQLRWKLAELTAEGRDGAGVQVPMAEDGPPPCHVTMFQGCGVVSA